MENEIEENSRSEYPAARIVLDIFELLQAMMEIGFSFTTYWRSHCIGEPLLTVDVWEADDPNNRFGVADPTNPEPNAIYPVLNGCEKGRASYNETETRSLHRLYDNLFDIYKKRKGDSPSPLPF